MEHPETLHPHEFQHTIVSLYGDRGAVWLQRLPTLIDECEARWSIAVGPPLPGLTYNYVAPATGLDGAGLILKLGVPNPELLSEIDALRFYQGRGCVRLLAWDREVGALLLERLQPGTPLSRLCPGYDERATSIAAGVMRALWRPAPEEHAFVTVGRWAAGFQRLRARFDGETGPLPEGRVRQAEQIFADLLASAAEPTLLHGDLHHDNILDAGHGTWRAIDPKGVVGEPAYEVGALLRNPFPALLSWPQPERILARRLDQLSAELGLDRQRLLDWALAQAVLSAWWCVEDRVPCLEGALACAELLAGLQGSRTAA
jgi:streptomycin 6-kinase